ncbi:hypothetical protein COR50_11685 [Chitinophaga caeni]|uniref:Protochlamydia outer membrane protein domain-containing protein n=1 Tax=Chitinophaga caeni TaxID=2029983 RepID=A0A291QV59_9BACT|nr:hypothetical protein [Chitinophaga caeni]ATL47772.1 hypothetical protein COR50_11685 [Chitinophaga caeni]
MEIKYIYIKYLCVALLFCHFSLKVQAQQGGATLYEPGWQVSVAPYYSIKQMHWSVAGNTSGMNPNILSELKWKSVQSIGGGIEIKKRIYNNLWGQVAFYKAGTVAGNATDADYRSDYRQDRTYFDRFDASRGFEWLFTPGVAYLLKINRYNSLNIYAGYYLNKEKYYLLPQGGNTRSDLKTTYQPTWKAWSVGFTYQLNINPNWNISPSFTYRQLDYDAAANWNLIEDFQHPVSFEHYAKGFEIQPQLDLSYFIKNGTALTFRVQYAHAATGHGSEALYLVNGETRATRLNGVTRDRFGLSLLTGIYGKK